MITIALADHHHLIRESVRSLLEKEKAFNVVGEVADGLKVVRLVERRKPLPERAAVKAPYRHLAATSEDPNARPLRRPHQP